MKKFSILVFCIIFIFISFLIVENIIKQFAIEICIEEASRIIGKALNDSLLETTKEPIMYEDLITIKLDEQGNVVLVQSNTLKMNQLAAKADDIAQNHLEEVYTNGLTLPLGYFLGSQFFSNMLPNIKIHFKQSGNITAVFESKFESAGINQTIHKIYLRLDTAAYIVLPGYSEKFTQSISFPICETIIIGNVPDRYLNIE